MAKPELGLKRTCVDCNTRFYDLQRVPPACPKCGAVQPSHISRLKQQTEELPDEKNKKLDQDDNDVDLDTADAADDDVISPDDDLDDDISDDIEEVTTNNKEDRDDS